jgi:RNA polymerase sigma-70 factor (ECF subfamily)
MPLNEFEEIYNKYQPEVMRFLMHLTSFDSTAAEELTQETFYQAFLSFGKFRGECSLRTWLFQIAKNIYAKYIRKETRQRDIKAQQSDLSVPPPTDDIEQKEVLSKLRELIDELDEPARSVVQYRLYSDISYAEIAAILKIRPNTAAVIYNRTVVKFRKIMKERYGYEI